MHSELISLHIGRGGVQIGNSLWELFCLEHLVTPDGEMMADDNNIPENDFSNFMFERSMRDTLVPRALFIDTEPSAIEEIETGAYRQLYNPAQLIKGTEDAASNYARGCFHVGKAVTFELIEKLRKVFEQCNNVNGFLLTNTLGGGTGSGVGALISHVIKTEYIKNPIIQVPIVPCSPLSTSVVESYNSLVHLATTLDIIDLSLLFDNSAMYELFKLDFSHSTSFTDINQIISLMISSILCPMRFPSQLKLDMSDLLTNLVPYPKIHHPITNYGPLFINSFPKKTSILSVTESIFKNVAFQSVKCFSECGKYFAGVLNYRGNVSIRDINSSLQSCKSKHSVNFVDWCPTGFKISLTNHLPIVPICSKICVDDMSLCMLANTTHVKSIFHRLASMFDSLFDRKAFVHWYYEEGMEETEFLSARNSIETLIMDYQQMEECDISDEESLEIEPSELSEKESIERSSREKSAQAFEEKEGPYIKSKRLLARRHSDQYGNAMKPRKEPFRS